MRNPHACIPINHANEKARQRTSHRGLSELYLRHCLIALVFIAVLLPHLGSVSGQQPGFATLQGTITTFDNLGEQLPLAWVRINVTSRVLNLTIYTNTYGFYQMVLPAGTYRISTYLRGYSSVFQNITLIPGQTMISNFYLRWQARASTSPN